MEGQFLTDKGQVRNHNEDSGGVFYSSSKQLLAIIADGMGGHQAGDVASQMATGLLKEKWEQCDKLTSPQEAEDWVSRAISDINKSIYKKAIEKEECRGMGTTVVITICTKEFMTIAHIGDSRCYLLHDNILRQMTEDHSLVNELVRSGQITKEEAEYHPRKNVLLKALGTEEDIAPSVRSLEWQKDNILILCSDGLINKVTDLELGEFLSSSKDIRQIGEEMIELANERGGEDNISLVIVKDTNSVEFGEILC
ncbi:Stp1/IreP family PP2C-type Ser/Thr phosphatase [Virgibacillus halodenitrificans]|uniref:Stp1/IreP family PP2C-type Ser/Thr phosphatase n=1 Tax=Virgibacillus halodenitrificans TaxID=1482 RepID=UPI0024BF960E|nr:Stp1/IreP family PP2C-type Ser/Thr phosphatase [Virgibacillus halodenitrificans]WHX27117.1 Stp1/IreP family PP2C-type Ser/Thr phosphatase [Virgibacillus halodenitrificans]